MKTLLLHPRQYIFEEIVSFLNNKAKDYSENLIVFPGKRPSYFLRKTLAIKLRTSFIPPKILSMDEFVDFIYASAFSDEKIDTIDAIEILYNINRKATTPLGESNFLSLDNFFPLGIKLYRDLEELYIEGISSREIESIQTFIDEKIPDKSMERFQSLSYFYNEFYTTIHKLNQSTRSMRYRIASELIKDTTFEKYKVIILAGFFALTQSEKKLFRRLSSFDKSIFIFQDGKEINKTLKGLGINAERKNIFTHQPEVNFYSSPDTHGQIYALSNIIKKMLKENKTLDEKTVIVLPSSDTLFPLLRQGLNILSEDQYNVSLGYPLHRTPIFGFFNNLIELINSMEGERIYTPNYIKFVLHPYIKNIYFNGNSEITRIMFHCIEDILKKNKTKTFLTIDEIEEDENILNYILSHIPKDSREITPLQIKEHLKTIHKNTINRFLMFQNIQDFSFKCIDLITYIYSNSTAKLHPLFYPFSESFIKYLDMISKSRIKHLSFNNRGSYFTFFKKYIMTCYSPFEGTPLKGLQILGFLETRNINFDTVFILDANEDILPDTKKEDSLIPYKARQFLGLPTYYDRDKLTQYYFENLINGAINVHIFFCENDKMEKSRFVEKLLWEKQKKDRIKENEKYISFIQYEVDLGNNPPKEINKSKEIIDYLKDIDYNATNLDTYLRCPIQFYYSYVLSINKEKDFSIDIDKTEIGKIAHKILSLYFSNKKKHVLKQSDINIDEIERITDTYFKSLTGEYISGPLFLIKKQVIRHLKDFLKNYYIPLINEKSVTILNTEYDIKCRIKKYKFNGRIDIIEKRDNKVYIIDYKTSASSNSLKINFKNLEIDNRETWYENIGSLQLPLYLLLYIQKTKININNLNGMFLFIGRNLLNKEIESPLFPDKDNNNDNIETNFNLLRKIFFRLIDEITDISIPFFSTNNKKDVCPLCNYQYICGTQWIVKN